MADAGRTSDEPEASGRLLFVFALFAGLLLRLVKIGAPDLFGPEEGIWAVGARNVVEGGLGQFLGLSSTPLGAPSGTPVFFPLLLSAMIRVFGPSEWAIRLPSAFAGLVGAFVLERLVRRGFGQPAGHLAGCFAALGPPLVTASRAATVEPTLTVLGLAGIIFSVRALEEDAPLEAVVGGAFFGLGFLADGWAVLLFVAPLLGSILFRPGLLPLGRTRTSLALLALTTVGVGSLSLLAAAVANPSAFALQLATAFGADPRSRLFLSANPFFGAELRTIVRTLFFLLPLAGVGIAFLSREVGEAEAASGATWGERRLSHGTLWGVYAVELVILVAVEGKLPLSSTPVLPALSALAGLGATALLARASSPARVRFETTAALVSGLAVVAGALLLMALHAEPLFNGGSRGAEALPVAAILASTAGAAVLVSGRAVRRLRGHAAAAFLAAILLAEVVGAFRSIRRDLLTHKTGFRAVADQVWPVLASRRPRDLAFRAPEPEALAFRLFRTGRTWSGVPSVAFLEEEAAKGTVACWIWRDGAPVGPAAPLPEIRAWIEANAREVTADVDARAGYRTGLRVFLPGERPHA